VIGSAQQAPWIAYREGTKTCIAKIALGLLIVRKYVIDALRHNGEDEGTGGNWLYTNVGSDDKANAESILFNVVTEPQANELLIAGFGHLYYQATEENPDAGPPIRTIGIRFRSTRRSRNAIPGVSPAVEGRAPGERACHGEPRARRRLHTQSVRSHC